MEYIFAADIGTTQIKAAITDEQGRILDLMSRPNRVYHPHDGWSELDMEELHQTFCALSRALTERNPDAAAHIKGVGVTALGEGLWPLDCEMRPVRRAILWNDTRARSVEIADRPKLDKLLQEHHITPLFPAAPPMVLRWMRENEPEHYRRTAYGVHCGDYLNYRLTGRLFTDSTLSSTASVNVLTGEYFRPLFDWLCIGDKIQSMPQIRRSTDIVGSVTGEAAQATGLPPGTPVIAGALDAAATAFGAGAYQKGDACTIFGTSLCNIAVQSAEEVSHANPCGSTLCGVAPGTYLRMMSTNNGSAFLDWAKGMFAPDTSFEELERRVRAVPIGSNGLLAHPYLGGERAPFQDASACGGFYGLTAGHTRMDMMRAAYEGLILSLKDCYREIPSAYTRAFVAGGGANSGLLCALTASAIGVPVHRPAQKQLGIRGIAAAVRYALGYSAKLEPPAFCGDTFLPDQEDAQALDHMYAQYVSLREQLQPYWQKFRQEA